MREHPIPQDVTGYKFHLVGNMTIKQFAELFAGVILALIINASNLISIIKYPMAIFAVGFGAALAFVPFEERPLDHWVITFFKVLYKPTKFFWQRSNKIPDVFLYEPHQVDNNQVDIDLSPLRRQRIQEYLSSVNSAIAPDQWELVEQQRVGGVLSMFDQISIIQQPHNTVVLANDFNQIKTMGSKPNLKTRVRNISSNLPKPPTETVVFEQQYTNPIAQANIPNQTTYISNRHMVNTTQVASELVIPELESINVQDPNSQAQEEKLAQNHYQEGERVFSLAQAQQQLSFEKQLVAATTNDGLPFPNKPQLENQLAGMVFNTNREILTDTIVEIQNRQGQVVRAVKTNPLGQFIINTPLEADVYYINLEKDAYQFNTFMIELNNQRVPPLEIVANN